MPRKLNRIPIMLFKLEQLWLKHPDLRLGQLMYNLIYNEKPDLFNIEDDKLEKLIDEKLDG